MVVASLALMVVLPVTALDEERPARFGWQMYSANKSVPQVTAIAADGSRTDLPFENLVARNRPEVDYAAPVAQFVCNTRPGTTAVQVVRSTPRYEETFTCARS